MVLGGTYGHILSAVEQSRKEGKTLSFAHFDFIKPLPANTAEVFASFKRILVCELNCGQFAAYLRNIFPEKDFLLCNKVQGQPFLVQEIIDGVTKIMEA